MSNLVEAIERFKTRPHTPDEVTLYWRTRWEVFGGRVGVKFEVPDCEYATSMIAELEHLKVPRKLVYVPDVMSGKAEREWDDKLREDTYAKRSPMLDFLAKFPPPMNGRVLLGKIHPEMGGGWVFSESSFLKTIDFEGSGWVHIESDPDTPNLNTSAMNILDVQRALREETRSKIRGISLPTYIIGSFDCKDLNGMYFDESSQTRIPSSFVLHTGGLRASFQRSGLLIIDSERSSSANKQQHGHSLALGCRFEGVVE